MSSSPDPVTVITGGGRGLGAATALHVDRISCASRPRGPGRRAREGGVDARSAVHTDYGGPLDQLVLSRTTCGARTSHQSRTSLTWTRTIRRYLLTSPAHQAHRP